MFDIESKSPDEITIITKRTTIKFDLSSNTISADLAVGPITGPCEVEIGDATIRGIATKSGQTIYSAEVNNVRIGIIGGCEENLDDIVADILCTSSVRAVREIEPKLVVAMGNADGLVRELKLTARTEKKLKVKNVDNLPTTQEVVILS